MEVVLRCNMSGWGIQNTISLSSNRHQSFFSYLTHRLVYRQLLDSCIRKSTRVQILDEQKISVEKRGGSREETEIMRSTAIAGIGFSVSRGKGFDQMKWGDGQKSGPAVLTHT